MILLSYDLMIYMLAVFWISMSFRHHVCKYCWRVNSRKRCSRYDYHCRHPPDLHRIISIVVDLSTVKIRRNVIKPDFSTRNHLDSTPRGIVGKLACPIHPHKGGVDCHAALRIVISDTIVEVSCTCHLKTISVLCIVCGAAIIK